MADDTSSTKRLVVCSCGRSLVLPRSGALRRVKEQTEIEVIWLVYVDDRLHHVCSPM